MIERRIVTMPVEIRAEEGEDSPGRLVGHAAVYDSPTEIAGLFREEIAAGAFADVLEDDVRALFNHDSNLILGRWPKTLSLREDERGLVYELQLPDTQMGRDLAVSVQRGDVSQSSFSFEVDREEWQRNDDGMDLRRILHIEKLWDVAPVTYPAYEDTDVAMRGYEAMLAEREKAGENETEKIRTLRQRTATALALGAPRRSR